MSDLVRVVPRDAGALWHVTFGTGNGNILDCATMRELARVFEDARTASDLKAICLEGAGADFSFLTVVSMLSPEFRIETQGDRRETAPGLDSSFVSRLS